MAEDAAARKQPMIEDEPLQVGADLPTQESIITGKQPMIEDEQLQGGADLPTQESTVEANPKPTRSNKSMVAAV
ncbi:hypothetical protein Tco_0166466, partial [Tanacetum coccineum]